MHTAIEGEHLVLEAVGTDLVPDVRRGCAVCVRILDRQHQPESAHVRDEAVFAHEFGQAAFQVCALFDAIFENVTLLKFVQDGQGRGRGDRIAAESRPVHAGMPFFHDLGGAHDRTHRQTSRDRLAECHDVRHDAEVLAGEHFAGPPVAGLNLVENQQDPILIAEGAKTQKEVARGDEITALALNRLDENRGDRLRRDDVPEEILYIVQAVFCSGLLVKALGTEIFAGICREIDAAHMRLVEFPIFGIRSRNRGGADCAAVEGAFERDDRRPLGVCLRELDRPVRRLRAAVRKEDRAKLPGHDPGEASGEMQCRLIVHQIERRGDERLRLLLYRLDDPRVAVAERVDRDPLNKVEILVSVLRGQVAAFAACDNKVGGLGKGGTQIGLVIFEFHVTILLSSGVPLIFFVRRRRQKQNKKDADLLIDRLKVKSRNFH